jgi:hypothetical protein
MSKRLATRMRSRVTFAPPRKLLGHKRIVTTLRYAQLSPGHQLDAVRQAWMSSIRVTKREVAAPWIEQGT